MVRLGGPRKHGPRATGNLPKLLRVRGPAPRPGGAFFVGARKSLPLLRGAAALESEALLVGPAAKDEIFGRHFGESLAGLALLDPGDRTLVDLGSGAGFPGLVLAIARPDLQVFLIEARERKWAFLAAAVRRCGLSVRTLNVRVAAPQPAPASLPAQIDVVTCRAVAITHEFLSPFLGKTPPARFLLWQGREEPSGIPQLRQGREVSLAGRHRRIVEWLETAEERPPQP